MGRSRGWRGREGEMEGVGERDVEGKRKGEKERRGRKKIDS